MTNKSLEVTPEQNVSCGSSSSKLIPDKEFGEKVDRAIELHRSVNAYTLELNVLKAELREAARARLPDGKKRTPAGESVSIIGTDGIATVSFENPRTIAAFWFQGDALAMRYKNNQITPLGEMKKIAGKCFARLFRPQFKPTKNFAHMVASLRDQKRLSKPKANELLSLCLEESTPKVELEDLS